MSIHTFVMGLVRRTMVLESWCSRVAFQCCLLYIVLWRALCMCVCPPLRHTLEGFVYVCVCVLLYVVLWRALCMCVFGSSST